MSYHIISFPHISPVIWSGSSRFKVECLALLASAAYSLNAGTPKGFHYIYIYLYIYIYKVCTFEGTISRNPSCFLGLQTKVSYDFLYIFVYFPWSQSIVCCNSGIISAASRWFWCCTECSSTLLAGKLLPVWAPWKKRTHTHRNTHLNNKLPLNQHRPLRNAAVEDYFPPSMTAFQSLW